MSLSQVLNGHCVISKVCQYLKMNKKEFCLNEKTFMNTLKRKQNELFKVNVWLREDHLRLRLKWTDVISQKSFCSHMFRRNLLGVPDPFPPFPSASVHASCDTCPRCSRDGLHLRRSTRRSAVWPSG